MTFVQAKFSYPSGEFWGCGCTNHFRGRAWPAQHEEEAPPVRARSAGYRTRRAFRCRSGWASLPGFDVSSSDLLMNVFSHLSGVYTCVAWNLEGADTKSVSVSVDSRGFGGGRGWSDEPSREHPRLVNSSGAGHSLVVLTKVPAAGFSLFVCNNIRGSSLVFPALLWSSWRYSLAC